MFKVGKIKGIGCTENRQLWGLISRFFLRKQIVRSKYPSHTCWRLVSDSQHSYLKFWQKISEMFICKCYMWQISLFLGALFCEVLTREIWQIFFSWNPGKHVDVINAPTPVSDVTLSPGSLNFLPKMFISY